ncbi:MAG: cytidine deaminase [Christensenellales bacterium]|jgi:cytidine deaminase
MYRTDAVTDYVQTALEARERAYAPYSHFRVGACLVAEDGRVFTGCNVENAAYPATRCAEQGALLAAVAAGARRFAVIAIASDSADFTLPCGVCRQMLSEFAPNLRVICANREGTWREYSLETLLPGAFCAAAMEGEQP